MSDLDKSTRVLLIFVGSVFMALGIYGVYQLLHHEDLAYMILVAASIYIEGQCFIYYAQTLE